LAGTNNVYSAFGKTSLKAILVETSNEGPPKLVDSLAPMKAILVVIIDLSPKVQNVNSGRIPYASWAFARSH
jgi:hypothetical protein